MTSQGRASQGKPNYATQGSSTASDPRNVPVLLSEYMMCLTTGGSHGLVCFLCSVLLLPHLCLHLCGHHFRLFVYYKFIFNDMWVKMCRSVCLTTPHPLQFLGTHIYLPPQNISCMCIYIYFCACLDFPMTSEWGRQDFSISLVSCKNAAKAAQHPDLLNFNINSIPSKNPLGDHEFFFLFFFVFVFIFKMCGPLLPWMQDVCSGVFPAKYKDVTDLYKSNHWNFHGGQMVFNQFWYSLAQLLLALLPLQAGHVSAASAPWRWRLELWFWNLTNLFSQIKLLDFVRFCSRFV